MDSSISQDLAKCRGNVGNFSKWALVDLDIYLPVLSTVDFSNVNVLNPSMSTSTNSIVMLKNLKSMSSRWMGSRGGMPSSGIPVAIVSLKFSRVLYLISVNYSVPQF